ncbi:MAG: aminoglycoside phosphotransferase family protein [Caldilineaceae bacterium]
MVIAELLQQTTSNEAIQFEKIVRGYDNEVYAVTTRQGFDYIVRIQQYGSTGFAEEDWALAQCRAAGAPVPDVCHVGTLTVDGQSKLVMVQRRIPGRPLADIQQRLSQAELAHIYAQVGAALSQIHSVKVGGFYKLNSGGVWDFPDWASIAAADLHDRQGERPYLHQAGFSAKEIDRLLAIMEQTPTPVDQQPVLCHGDLGPDHLFVDGSLTLTGIIDFGEFQGGLPMVDFVSLSLASPAVDLAWLQVGYTNQALFVDHFTARLRQGQVSYLIGYLAHCVRIQDEAEVKQATQRLHQILGERNEQ